MAMSSTEWHIEKDSQAVVRVKDNDLGINGLEG